MKIYFTLFFVSMLSLSWSQESIAPKVRNIVDMKSFDKEIDIYLLVGQSNMAGSSPVMPMDTLSNPRVLRFNQNNKWEVAKEPLRVDKDIIGMGPGLAFGKYMAQNDSTKIIGLIPAAVGGTSINLWVPGAQDPKTHLYPYDQAVSRAKNGMKDGVLKGIIWHQGESDSNSGKSKGYKQKLKAVIERFRKDLNVENVPFVAGLLPKYQIVKKVDGKRTVNQGAKAVNRAILELKKEVNNYDVITLKKAKDKGDGTHLDSKSARALGKKYAEAIIRLRTPQK